MEKLAAHITKIGCSADDFTSITAQSAMALAEQARNLSIDFAEWYNNLKPLDKVTCWPPKGSGLGTGIYTIPLDELFDKFLEQKTF